MALSKSVMRNVARFRIRGHGLKCEKGKGKGYTAISASEGSGAIAKKKKAASRREGGQTEQDTRKKRQGQ